MVQRTCSQTTPDGLRGLVACSIALLGLLPGTAACADRDPFAGSIQVDSGFAYYQDRSKDGIASEVKASGYGCVRLIVTRDSAADAGLVDACHRLGMAVWYTTFGNGVYSTGDLPQGWETWRMKLLAKQANEAAAGFTYLCLNNPQYREWKKKQVVATLKRIPFDGFEMAEPFWPAFKGPESDHYGCLCDHCKSAFLRMHPEEEAMPDFSDKSSPNYYKTNRELYAKWIEFRVRSVAEFQSEIVNGQSGVRKAYPRVKVAVWGIADAVPDCVNAVREWEGIDGPLIVRTVRPDLYVLQTDWPDWSNPELKPDYPLQYKPFVDAIRASGSKVPIVMQADIGSWETCRRGRDWMRKCEAAARRAGMAGITAYEFHLGADIYDAPPQLVSASGRGDTIVLLFSKRLNSSVARTTANYDVDAGSVVSVVCDGNIVKLEVKCVPTRITVRNLEDDPSRRLFKKHPPAVMKGSQSASVQWSKEDR